MTITIGNANINRTMKVYTEGVENVNRTAQKIHVGNGGINRLVFSASDGILYDNGDIKFGVTGGWTVRSYNSSTNYTFSTSPTMSMTNRTGGWITVYTVNPINLTNYTKVKFTLLDRNQHVEFGIADTQEANPVPISSKVLDVATVGTFEISIAPLTGSHYIYVATDWNSGAMSSVSKIWLE